jgi:predicted site-specific integrase-resolvase
LNEKFGDDSSSLLPLLSAKQVAQIFDRNGRTLRNWVRKRYLRPVRVGRSVFFREEDIETLLDAGGPPRS